jgi:hypothetical protein
MKKGIVISGISGVGKDELFKTLKSFIPSMTNVKFADPVKRAFAAYLDVPIEYLEDRESRVLPIEFLDGDSVLDLLVKSHKVMPSINSKLGLYSTDKQVKRMLLDKSGIPVFTDTRNVAEVDWLLETFKPNELLLIRVRSNVRGRRLESDCYLDYIEAELRERHDALFYLNDEASTDRMTFFADKVVTLFYNT